MILYVNSCVRENSRTDFLAKKLLAKLGDYTELNLAKENLQPLSKEALGKRFASIEKGDYSDDIFKYAKLFASADQIVISAPFWDLSFPSSLKIFIENIYILGITTRISEQGRPIGLCKADKLYYVTTSGGMFSETFGYNYIKTIVENCFGVKSTELIKAEMLDVRGSNNEKILEECIKKYNL